jgi:hypothetical protein
VGAGRPTVVVVVIIDQSQRSDRLLLADRPAVVVVMAEVVVRSQPQAVVVRAKPPTHPHSQSKAQRATHVGTVVRAKPPSHSHSLRAAKHEALGVTQPYSFDRTDCTAIVGAESTAFDRTNCTAIAGSESTPIDPPQSTAIVRTNARTDPTPAPRPAQETIAGRWSNGHHRVVVCGSHVNSTTKFCDASVFMGHHNHIDRVVVVMMH